MQPRSFRDPKSPSKPIPLSKTQSKQSCQAYVAYHVRALSMHDKRVIGERASNQVAQITHSSTNIFLINLAKNFDFKHPLHSFGLHFSIAL